MPGDPVPIIEDALLVCPLPSSGRVAQIKPVIHMGYTPMDCPPDAVDGNICFHAGVYFTCRNQDDDQYVDGPGMPIFVPEPSLIQMVIWGVLLLAGIGIARSRKSDHS